MNRITYLHLIVLSMSILLHVPAEGASPDPCKDGGNVTPEIVTLAPDEEGELLKDVTVPLFHKSAADTNMPPQALAQTVTCLLKVRNEDSLASVLSAMSLLDQSVGGRFYSNPAKETFYKSASLGNAIHKLVTFAGGDTKAQETLWAHAALLGLAARKNAGVETQSIAQKEIDLAWQDTDRKVMLIMIARVFKNHYLDARIAVALSDPAPDVVNQAEISARQLRIQPTGADKTPKIGDLKIDVALAQVNAMKGDPALGEAVFMKAACVTCHTVNQDQLLKGPYLGNISGIYNRDELAIAILDPNRTIAQGFASPILNMKDKTALTGFITAESADVVQLRDMASKEHTVKKSDIAERSTIPTSMMPPALMNAFSVKEFVSLLDYIESLSKP
jgi:putative heme-binding domain-containing protein